MMWINKIPIEVSALGLICHPQSNFALQNMAVGPLSQQIKGVVSSINISLFVLSMINPPRPSRLSLRRRPPVTTVKISLDDLIRQTYTHLAHGDIKAIIQSRVPSSNPLILEYIKSIYQTYSIEDPSLSTPSKARVGRKLSTSEEKIKRMKRDSANYTPSTEKEMNSTASIKKRIMSSTHKKEPSSFFNESPIVLQEASAHGDQKGQINPVFRYCVICENLILEHNILCHESKCIEFNSLYASSNEEIVSMIVAKINKFKIEIQSLTSERAVLIERGQESNIKSSVREWIDHVEEGLTEVNFGLKHQRLYEKVVECFKSNTLRLAELTKKMRWFLRIREQLKAKFGI